MSGAAPDKTASLIRLGVIIGAHGIRGAVKVKTFTQDPKDLSAYGSLCSEDGGQVFDVSGLSPDKVGARVSFKNIHYRDQAEALKGTVLCVPRLALPALDEEAEGFYHADLLGLTAYDASGQSLGLVEGVHNFGAGDVLDIAGEMIAFTKQTVPEIDLTAGRLTVIMPVEVEARPPEQESPELAEGSSKTKRRRRRRKKDPSA